MLWTALAAACLLLTSCVSTTSVRLGANEYPEPPQHVSVVVYEVIEDVPGAPEKIGIVRAEAGLGVSWERMVRNLKREARCLGANGIVLAHADDQEGVETRTVLIPSTLQPQTISVRQMSALAVRTEDGSDAQFDSGL